MLAHLFESRGEAVSMLWPHRGKGSQDDEIERALKKFDAICSCTSHSSAIRS
jgi:hypothetical protein